jgi:hypothetical protein
MKWDLGFIPVLLILTAGAASAGDRIWSEPRAQESSVDPVQELNEPITLYLKAPRLEDVRAAFRQAGWTEAAKNSWLNRVGYSFAALTAAFTSRYSLIQSLPISTHLFRGQPFVAAFEKNVDPLGRRHHCRLFDLGLVDKQGNRVWAMSASRDVDLSLTLTRPTQAFLTHAIEPNVDLERDLIIEDLRRSGGIEELRAIKVRGTAALREGRAYSADGRIYILRISSEIRISQRS